VDFRSKKSKELLAFAVNKDGAYATMEEAVEALWPNKDSETGKISYRDSVWKLKRTLNENGLDNLVEFQRGRFRVNKNTASL
jgi:two-component SAPR family response regulator